MTLLAMVSGNRTVPLFALYSFICDTMLHPLWMPISRLILPHQISKIEMCSFRLTIYLLLLKGKLVMSHLTLFMTMVFLLHSVSLK